MNKQHELGYFGNIWVRQNVLERAGDFVGGHIHLFDHVSLLARGSVEVSIDGYPPKIFTAPTFIVIKKEHRHRFTALEDDTLWYCVFAIRDDDGELTDIYPDTSNPLFINSVGDTYWDHRKKLEKMSINIGEKPFPSWTLDAAQQNWIPPVPYPQNGNSYTWNEPARRWERYLPTESNESTSL